MGRRCFVETFGPHFPPDDMALHLQRMFGPGGLPTEMRDPEAAHPHGGGGWRDRRLSEARADEPAGAARAGALEIKQLYVLEPWQGAGVAAVLMDWAVETGRADGAPAIYLSVWEHGARAIAFYRRHGFEQVGVAPFQLGTRVYQDPVMRLGL